MSCTGAWRPPGDYKAPACPKGEKKAGTGEKRDSLCTQAISSAFPDIAGSVPGNWIKIQDLSLITGNLPFFDVRLT
jgi:hypothetical protein